MNSSSTRVYSLNQRPSGVRPGRPRRRLTVGRLVALALILYAVGLFINQTLALSALTQQEQILLEEIAALEGRQEELRRQVALLQSDVSIERLAREELGLTRSDEIAYAIYSQNQ